MFPIPINKQHKKRERERKNIIKVHKKNLQSKKKLTKRKVNTNQRNKKGAKFVVFIKFVLKYLDNFVRQCLEFLRTQPVFDLLKTKMQNLSLLANLVSKHKIDYN